MDPLLTLVLFFLLLLSLLGWLNIIRRHALMNQKLRTLEDALERSRMLTLQKDMTVRRQHDEIQAFHRHYSSLESQVPALQAAIEDWRLRFSALKEKYQQLELLLARQRKEGMPAEEA